jgi:cystathionine gamma-synthase
MTKPLLPDSTDAVHAGDVRPKPYDAVPTPIVQTATFSFVDSAEIVALTTGKHARADREEYGRYGNPTVAALEKRLAALDDTEDALVFASGMAALTTTVLALCKAGHHVVLFRDCYRMTLEFVTGTLGRLGIAHTLLEPGDLDALPGALRPETRLVIGESPTNPYLSCLDLGRLAEICRARGVKSLVDATFATPINCRPARFGIDLVVHSATKYLAGHNDVLAGVVAGPRGLCSLVRDLRGVLGSVCDPHAAFLVARGLKTLALRVERQNASAQAIAERLAAHPRVKRVFYPGLPTHATHAVAAAQMRGFGGVVSFIVEGGMDGAQQLVDRLTLPRIAPSFGGVESLVEQPALMSYYEYAPEDRAALGIDDGLVRLAVGIEEPGALLADLERALSPST